MSAIVPNQLRLVAELGILGLCPSFSRLLGASFVLSFAVLLIAVQAGLAAGFVRMISGVLDHAHADLWLAPKGTTAFDEVTAIAGVNRYSALKHQAVDRVLPLIVGYAEWRRRDQQVSSVIVVGTDDRVGPVQPWNQITPDADRLRSASGVVVDDTYSDQLDIHGVGSVGTINGHRVTVASLTSGIRSFTTSPYVFTSVENARRLLDLSPAKFSLGAIRLHAGDPLSNHDLLAEEIGTLTPDIEVLTPEEMKSRNVQKWLFDTGAGAALVIGTLVGFVVGAVVITQTIRRIIEEQSRQLATLRAMGASNAFIGGSLFCLVALIVGLALFIAVMVFAALLATAPSFNLPIEMSPEIAVSIIGACIAMVMAASLLSAQQFLRLDPASVLAR